MQFRVANETIGGISGEPPVRPFLTGCQFIDGLGVGVTEWVTAMFTVLRFHLVTRPTWTAIPFVANRYSVCVCLIEGWMCAYVLNALNVLDVCVCLVESRMG